MSKRSERPPATLVEVPFWLADRHRRADVDQLVSVDEAILGLAATDEGPGWDALVEGAGFEPTDEPGRLRRLHTLADLVGPDMRLLVIGLNPSPASADSGIAFARPGNRFWPATLAAGLVTKDREPIDALVNHGVGFTDIVKRTTRKASELSRDEFRSGMARADGLCRWLRPQACVMVGLMGWRTAVDAKAKAGWQDMTLGESPVYVMPSTSGLNANSSLADLTGHLTEIGKQLTELP